MYIQNNMFQLNNLYCGNNADFFFFTYNSILTNKSYPILIFWNDFKSQMSPTQTGGTISNISSWNTDTQTRRNIHKNLQWTSQNCLLILQIYLNKTRRKIQLFFFRSSKCTKSNDYRHLSTCLPLLLVFAYV